MYTVKLSSCGNIDYGQNPYEPLYDVPKRVIKATSIEECQQIVRNYIDFYNLGSGNWDGGDVFKDGKLIGYISYNGRYWNHEK